MFPLIFLMSLKAPSHVSLKYYFAYKKIKNNSVFKQTFLNSKIFEKEMNKLICGTVFYIFVLFNSEIITSK